MGVGVCVCMKLEKKKIIIGKEVTLGKRKVIKYMWKITEERLLNREGKEEGDGGDRDKDQK